MIETILEAPNENELEEIYKKAEGTEKCSGQWTAWNSVANPLRYNGNDYETLRELADAFGRGAIISGAMHASAIGEHG